MQDIVKRLNFFFSLLIIVSLLSLSYWTFPWADDYGIFALIRNNDILSTAKYFYLNWDGRIISPEGLFMLFTYKYLPVKLTILIKSLVFIYSMYLISKLIFKSKASLINMILIVFIFFFGLRSSVSDMIYWTCGSYAYSFLIILLFLHSLNRKKEKSIWVIILAFLLGFAGPNNFLIAFSIILIQFFNNYIENGTFQIRKVKYLIFSILGFCMILIAPGNSKRGFNLQELSLPNLINKILNNYTQYNFQLFDDFKIFILLCVLLGLIWDIKTQLFSKNIVKEFSFFTIVYLILLFPYAIAEKYEIRSFWPNALILLLGLINLTSFFKEKAKKTSQSINFSLLKKLKPYLILAILLFFFFYIFRQHLKAKEVHHQFLVREQTILTKKKDGLTNFCIKELDFSNRSFIHSSKDISEISYLNYIGEGMEKYYEVDSLWKCPENKNK